METEIYQEQYTPLNAQIELVFNEVVKYMAILRTDITMNRPGELYDPFCDFKEAFDYLFSLSCDRIENDIIKDIEKWLNNTYHNLTINDVKCGIKLFRKYKKILIYEKMVQINR